MLKAFFFVLIVLFMASGFDYKVAIIEKGSLRSPAIEEPQSRPSLATTIRSGKTEGVCFPVAKQFVITCYHVVKEGNSVVVNYPATMVWFDDKNDIALLETHYKFEKWYNMGVYSKEAQRIGKTYQHGDSGTPIFDKSGNVISILVGKGSDGIYVTCPVTKAREVLQNYISITSSSSP